MSEGEVKVEREDRILLQTETKLGCAQQRLGAKNAQALVRRTD
jgi:hypothetical protein